MSNLEIQQVGENEYLIGKNRTVFIDRKIIHITAIGEITTEIAKLHSELDSKLFSLADGKVSYLIDLTKCGKNSHEANLTFRQLCYHPNVDKVAIYGINPVARVVASFVIGFDPKKKQRFFKTNDKALIWLLG